MTRALELARAMLGRTSPNPAVGCVIVRGDRVVGEGATRAGGRPHAEIVALRKAGRRARGATAYVSLEPCAHYGRTPPCAQALVEAGIKRAVVGCVDPYPKVHGRGLATLRRAGIDVTVGVLEEECRQLNEGFITRILRGRPLGLLKLAMSLDGRIAAASGDSRWVSSPESRRLTHLWRSQSDAIMIGAGTVLIDNPRLTCRIRGGRDPVRVIVDGRLRTPPDALVYRERSTANAILVTRTSNLSRGRRRYRGSRVEVLAVAARGGELDLRALMREFAKRGWNRVLIEGGARLAASVLRAGVVDRIALFVAPRIVGSGQPAIDGLDTRRMRDALAAASVKVSRVGDDVLLEATITPPRRAR